MTNTTSTATTTADRNGHRWHNLGYNAYVCERCGLDDYAADGTGACRGHETYACPEQMCGDTHGTCAHLFDTRAAATAHWNAVHSTPAQREDYAAYVASMAARAAR